MAENSKIEWTDHTFNPWIGCTAIGPGCDHCYAEAMSKRFGKDFSVRTRTSAPYWRKPLKWNRKADAFSAEHGRRQRVFCASLADVFDNKVSAAWRADLFALIRETPNLDWLLLTKRVGNVLGMLPPYWDDGYFNVWLGATIVNQEEADRDIPKLLEVPAAVRFLSIEPLLSRVDLSKWIERLDQVIVGGESGPKARPMHPDWARSIRDQCVAAGVPFHFKQWGEWCPAGPYVLGKESIMGGNGHVRSCGAASLYDDDFILVRAGKKRTGREIDGRTWDEFPEAVA